MSPNPKLKLDLDSGPLAVTVISPDPQLAAELRHALRIRGDIVVTDGTGGADVIVWDTGENGQTSPLAVRGAATIALVRDADEAQRAVAAGARGVLPRTVDPSELVAAIIATRYGLSVRAIELEGVPAPAAIDLTGREREVLELLAVGLGNRAIAEDIGISEHTVKFHIAGLLHKLGAETRTEAVVSALRMGILRL